MPDTHDELSQAERREVLRNDLRVARERNASTFANSHTTMQAGASQSRALTKEAEKASERQTKEGDAWQLAS